MAYKQVTAADNSTVTMSIDGVGGLVLKSNGATQVGTPQINAANPCFSAYQNAASSAFTVSALQPFQVKAFDTTNAFNNTASTVGNTLPYSFNPLVAGYYQIVGSVQSTATTTNLVCRIYKNGVSYKYGDVKGPSETTPMSKAYALVYLDGTGTGADSNIQIYASQTTSGTSITTDSVTYFQAALISRTA